VEIHELISFYHTARLRSVSRAAAYLDLGQPTVTTHLQRLEKEFGVQLFDRIKRPIRLTVEGVTFFELAEPVVQAVEQGLENLKIQMNHPERRDSFTIGAYPDLALNYLPEVVKQYQERFPENQIKLVARSYSVLMEMLDSGEVDLALIHAPERGSQALAFQKLFESDFLLLTPLGHPLLREPEPALESIARWPLILQSPQSYTRRYLERALRDAGVGHHLALEVDHNELVKRYVEIGMGVGIALEFDLQPDDQSKVGLIDLSYLFPPAQIGVVTLQGKFLSRGARNFIDTLLGLAGSSGVKGRPGRLEKSTNRA
jgi:DNA-binding transcriptional LysR family regulator